MFAVVTDRPTHDVSSVSSSRPILRVSVSAHFPDIIASFTAHYLEKVRLANWNMPVQGMLVNKLSNFHQHVNFVTREEKTLDLVYTNVKKAFKAAPVSPPWLF